MISVERLVKRFGAFKALDDVSLTVPEGKLMALLGPSGSGKTTLLRCLAGLDHPDSGDIRLDGVDAAALRAKDRRVGFVFQHYALFRHMTVADNVGFGLKVRKGKDRPPAPEIALRVGRLLELVQLAGLAGRYPSQLSGGQRQRVALARALAVEPRLLLLDEPFGALDAQVRKDLRRWLRRLHDDMGLTSVFVTHDQEEALELADEVVVMNKGRIEQIGSPAEIYDHPASPFVFQFLGHANRLDCLVRQGVGAFGGWSFAARGVPDGPGVAFVRPHDVDVGPADGAAMAATLRHAIVLGPTVRLELSLPDQTPFEAELGREAFSRLDVSPGHAVGLTPRRVAAFPTQG
ncbi:MAG: sulfate/molybdate ABC transporter ATP-binding protein [Alphaproteobacteria bacterium]|nr:sulfate/molybdate ABC transporter ATP-binding protein [Alphaproteobacteria bacterium]